jgi:hypothetical protein
VKVFSLFDFNKVLKKKIIITKLNKKDERALIHHQRSTSAIQRWILAQTFDYKKPNKEMTQ